MTDQVRPRTEQKNVGSVCWKSQHTTIPGKPTLFNQGFRVSSLLTVLQILKEVGDINVLSTPQITAMDNITGHY